MGGFGALLRLFTLRLARLWLRLLLGMRTIALIAPLIATIALIAAITLVAHGGRWNGHGCASHEGACHQNTDKQGCQTTALLAGVTGSCCCRDVSKRDIHGCPSSVMP